MICENKFCLFQENAECLLDEIELDICGSCRTCIYVNFTDEELKKKKKAQIEKYKDIKK